VKAAAVDGSTHAWGIFVESATVRIEDSTVQASGSATSTRAIQGTGGSSLEVVRVRAYASGADEVIGIISTYGTARIVDSTGEAQGGSVGVGLYNEANPGSSFSARNGDFIASGGALSYGVRNTGSAGLAEFLSVRATGSSAGMNNDGLSGTVRAVGSIFEGASGLSTTSGAFDVRLSGGQVRGGVTGSGFTCAFVSDASFAALDATCN
jgi:hypothetical protein